MKGMLVILLVWAVPAAGQPHIAVRGEASFRFGTLRQGGILSHNMTLLNEGRDTLVIEHVDTPCRCTTTSLAKSRLAPGDSSRLTITFHSQDFIDSVSKFVTVVSNDLPRRDLFLHFTANIVSFLRIVPQTLIFGDVPVGKRVDGTVELINRGNDTLHLGKVITSDPLLEAVSAPLSLAPGERAGLTLSFSPSLVKSYGMKVEVELNRADQPRAYFWVSARGVLP